MSSSFVTSDLRHLGIQRTRWERGIYTLGKGLRSQTDQSRAASVERGAGTTVGCGENTGQKCLVHLLELPLAPQIPSTAPPPAPVQRATLFSLRQEKQSIRVRHWRSSSPERNQRSAQAEKATQNHNRYLPSCFWARCSPGHLTRQQRNLIEPVV